MSHLAAAENDQILTKVELIAVTHSIFKAIYSPTEKIPTVVVDSFPELGRLAAARFLEWVQANPGGVVSLPTGKTPEHFINWVKHFLSGWDDPKTAAELNKLGIDPSVKPDISSLHFVQIDEFYPMEPKQHNSFNHYVKEYYIKGFGLDPGKCLLIDTSQIGLTINEKLSDYWPDGKVDLSLRSRQANSDLEKKQKALLERIDQWCMEYEQKIQNMGGIGFFLGGIGPDGHIGFNIKGSDHNSTTRLCETNYETQAAAATDLGGIEISRNRLVITIGLKSITRNPDCTAIIISAGAAKAGITAKAIQSEKDVSVPASALQDLPNARFYITRGAAADLQERQLELLKKDKNINDIQLEDTLINICNATGKSLDELNEEDCLNDPFGRQVLEKRQQPLEELTKYVYGRLLDKISKGTNVLENKRFLHTEPHHDDVMLGYFAHVVRHFRRASNSHHFMTLTSGFTSVTNDFMLCQLKELKHHLGTDDFLQLFSENYFRPESLDNRNRDVWQYLDGVAGRNEELKSQGCSRRLLRNLFEISDRKSLREITEFTDELIGYFEDAYPGKLDPPHVQQLKGMSREWEAECLWGYYGWKCENVQHMRLGFYKGTIFTEEPTHDRDVEPIVHALHKINPDIVTVAFDPEASGPDTHYKVLQAMAEALRIYQDQSGKDVTIWGYRNVWYRFAPSEVDIYVPVSLCMFSVMDAAFMNAFLSQKNASFPSYEYDGPFSHLAQNIQVSQYQKIKTCLGRKWFYDNDSPLIRATRGFIYLKKMKPQEFYQSCRKLRESME